MEPITHFLTGACLSRAGFNRKAAYATLAMTLAAEAPDLDVLWGLRGPVTGFEHHRGITHTLIAAPVIALITEWGRTDQGYTARAQHLNGGSGGLNGETYLTPATIAADSAIDQLYGEGNQDLFFSATSGPADVVNSPEVGEWIIPV